MRTFRKLALGAVALGFLVLLAVEFAPAGGARAAAPGFAVGFAEADCTPALGGKPVYLAGFGHDRRATKVHDAIMCRAVVFKDHQRKLALVTLDVVGLFYPEVQAVRQELRDFAYVLVSSTHSHEGPDTLGLWGPSPVRSGVDPDYLKLLREKIVEAVRAADGAAQPAVARLGHVKAPELLHDGREPYVLHDGLHTLRFVAPTEPTKTLGLLVNWHCHPETMSSKNTELTADFPYYAVKALKAKHGCPVAYFTGAVGGLMTSLHVPLKDDGGQELRDGTWEKTERYGLLLARRCDEAIQQDQPVALAPMEFRSRALFVPMTNPLYHLGRKLGVLKREAFAAAGDLYRAAPVGKETKDADMAVETEIAALLLGEVRVACIPGEIYPELALGKVQDPADPGADFPDAPAEPAVFASLGGKHQLLLGLANDEIGYIIPKRQWDEKPPYCYGRKKKQYGEENSVGPEAAPSLCRAFAELMR